MDLLARFWVINDGSHDTRVYHRAAPTAAVLTWHPRLQCSRACSAIIFVAPTTTGGEPSDLVFRFCGSAGRLGMANSTLFDGKLDENLDLAVVLGAKRGIYVRRALRVVRGRAGKRPIGGSRRGQRSNLNRGFDMGAHGIMRDYFGVGGEPQVYVEREFERLYRMPCAAFQWLSEAVFDEPWWKRFVSGTGRSQSLPIQTLVAALRVLGYGEAYDGPDEYCRWSRSTIFEATRRLTDLIVEKWETTCLRRSTEDELKHILARNAAPCKPGCIGSIDCAHWQWIRCPKALAGQYCDSEGKRSVVIDSVCDEDTYIWHFYSGVPGRYINKNALESSPFVLDVNAGLWPPRRVHCTLNGRTRRLLLYTAD